MPRPTERRRCRRRCGTCFGETTLPDAGTALLSAAAQPLVVAGSGCGPRRRSPPAGRRRRGGLVEDPRGTADRQPGGSPQPFAWRASSGRGHRRANHATGLNAQWRTNYFSRRGPAPLGAMDNRCAATVHTFRSSSFGHAVGSPNWPKATARFTHTGRSRRRTLWSPRNARLEHMSTVSWVWLPHAVPSEP